MKNQKIRLVGVWWAWNNTINRLYLNEKISIESYIINTNKESLDKSPLQNKILIWDWIWVGANWNLWREIAIQSEYEISKSLESIDILLLVAWLGWWTGTGVSPVIADMANKMDVLTIWFFTMPFAFEGQQRLESAKQGLELAKESFDIIFIVYNDKILNLADKKTPLKEAFYLTDDLIVKVLDWIQNDWSESISEKLGNKNIIEIRSFDSTIEEEIENTINPRIEKALSEDELNVPAFLRKSFK